MCGIFGYTFKDGVIEEGRRAILGNNLAKLNDKRGGDSWGIARVESKEVHLSRGLGDMGDHAYHFIEGNTLLAHTRFATVGAKTVENAHPFEIGKIVGAHNGVVYNHHELEKKYNRKCEVDSMHFFHHLDGGLAFSDIEGYGAIEWLHRDDPTRIYLSRLKGGSLAIFGIGDKEKGRTEGIVWSSDEKHLLESLYSAGIKNFFPYKVEEGSINFVHDGEIFIASAKKLELAERTTTVIGNRNRHSTVYEGHGYSNRGYRSGHSYRSGVGSGAQTFLGQSQNRDLSDWREWNSYCEEREQGNRMETELGGGD